MKAATRRRVQATHPVSPAADRADGGEVELSVVMPCLNEARTVGACVEKALRSLRELGVRGEVVVADNGSTDGSQALARAHGARVVHAERRGYGAALQAGIAAARGRYVVMGDADDSYDFGAGSLRPFLERLRAGDELVMGNRFKGGIMPGAMPRLHRYLGNPVLSGLLNLFFRTPAGDAHCGLRAFRRDSCLRLGLSSPGMEFASEMVVKAALAGQRMSEVPTVLRPDGRDRRPHLRSFRDGWRHLRFLLLFCPLWLYLVPAAALLGGGLAIMTWLTAAPGTAGALALELLVLLAAALGVLVGYQTLWLWAYARIYGWTTGVLPRATFPAEVFRRFNLERGLLAGAALTLTGLGIYGWLLRGWYANTLYPAGLGPVRSALWGLTLMVLGVQTIYGSFFLSMMGLFQRTPPSPGRGAAPAESPGGVTGGSSVLFARTAQPGS
jgi:glycosyltransferase involved in cell wall biosynthesis